MQDNEATLSRMADLIARLGAEVERLRAPATVSIDQKTKARSKTLLARLHKRNVPDEMREQLLQQAIIEGKFTAGPATRALPWQHESMSVLDPSAEPRAFEGLPWLPTDPLGRNLWVLLRLARLGGVEDLVREGLPPLPQLTGEGPSDAMSSPKPPFHGPGGPPSPGTVSYEDGTPAADAEVARYPNRQIAVTTGALYLPNGKACMQGAHWFLYAGGRTERFDTSHRKGQAELYTRARKAISEELLRQAWDLANHVWPERAWFVIYELAALAHEGRSSSP